MRKKESRVVVEKEEGRRDGAGEMKGRGRFEKLERTDRGKLLWKDRYIMSSERYFSLPI